MKYYDADGKHELLALLKTLRTIPSVRMCVASRPEVEFEQAKLLENAPYLQLHRLTISDMYKYALNSLSSVQEYRPNTLDAQLVYTPRHKRRLAKLIAVRADGVFLWAYTASRALQ